MKLASRDRTMLLSIAAPGLGFAVVLDGHTWFFDRDGNPVGSLPPLGGRHAAARSPEVCPGCVDFVLRNYGTS